MSAAAQLRDRIAAALRTAAKDCDGTCGLIETDCFEQHPIQVSVIHFEQVAGVYGYIDALAAVAAAEVQPLLLQQAGQLNRARERVTWAQADRAEHRADLDQLRHLITATIDQIAAGDADALALLRRYAVVDTHPAADFRRRWESTVLEAKRQARRAELAEAALATARASAFREAARLLEATGRDDDAVNLLDITADGITTHASSSCGCQSATHPGHYPSCPTRTAEES